MDKVVYLNVSQITEVHRKDVYLKDIASVFCKDQNILNRCNSLKIKSIKQDQNRRYVENVLDIIGKITRLDESIQVINIGEVDFIIDYHKPRPNRIIWEWIKTIFVCMVCFSGASFAIMTFNNDVSAAKVFQLIYFLVMKKESNGFTVLEMGYSIGLAMGIILFFNHFCKWKMTTDPTPLEVEMRIYEDNVSKTLIQNDGRKEADIDVS